MFDTIVTAAPIKASTNHVLTANIWGQTSDAIAHIELPLHIKLNIRDVTSMKSVPFRAIWRGHAHCSLTQPCTI
jgi:hypothetical protein